MPYSREFLLFLRDVISILKDNIKDLKERKNFAEAEEKEYIAARLFSYQEIVSTLRGQLKEYDISEKEIGLDDIDQIL